ncbi:MAG: ABC transporter permease [Xanthomonadales bacterium]|nr:ABC transporter permease [Xanthomonadales bacterium]
MPNTDTHRRLVVFLAWRDYWHEKLMSICFILALSAVLVPLLVLFGLKYGIVTNLLTPLKEDPRYRQILPVGSGKFGPEWFEAMSGLPEVAFIVPRTRAIAASISLRVADTDVGRIMDVELSPSAANDPVLGGLPEPTGLERVVLSRDAADKLGATTGTRLEGILTRIYNDESQTGLLPLEVAGVASTAAFGRDGLFVSKDLMVAVEDFRDGRFVPALGLEGVPLKAGPRNFSGFRLYARSLEDVAGLRQGLMDRGIDVRTRVADIELVAKLDRNLGIVFWIITIIAASGYGLSFGTSIWANVDRKRREFSVLRLTGFRTRGIVWFPILQALLTGVLGWAIAVVAFYLAQSGLNALFVDNIGGGQPICRLQAGHLGISLVMTLITATLAAALGGLRIAQFEPSLALREA